MTKLKISQPLKRSEVIERYFLEHRAKLIDIAAFLDRVDRAKNDSITRDDFRMAAFHEALGLLIDGRAARARRVLELFSDPSADPALKAGIKGALGAYNPVSAHGR